MNDNDLSAVERDIETLYGGKKKPTFEMLVEVARNTGISLLRLGRDFLKLSRGKGKLKFEEFVRYELYNREKWSEDEKEKFLSGFIHWPIFDQCVSRNWWAVTEDKWLSETFLKAAGLPTPTIVAVFDQSLREYPGTVKMSDTSELKNFLTSFDSFPIFAKSQNSMWSAGAFVISSATEQDVTIFNEGTISYDSFRKKYIGDSTYVFQKIVEPHNFFDGITKATPTVRLINMIRDSGLYSPFAVLKLPIGNNIADNFWRDENIVCNIDTETGEILSIVSKNGLGLTRHSSLPNVNRTFIGEKLPYWDELKNINSQVALMHSEIRFSSTDIAITQDGPIIIEVNCGSAFELPQIATGYGFLTDDVREFFRNCGCTLV